MPWRLLATVVVMAVCCVGWLLVNHLTRKRRRLGDARERARAACQRGVDQ